MSEVLNTIVALSRRTRRCCLGNESRKRNERPCRGFYPAFVCRSE